MTDGHQAVTALPAVTPGETPARIPDLVADRCVGCLACVSACPDVALFAVALPIADVEGRIDAWAEDADRPRLAADSARARFASTHRFADAPTRHGMPAAELGLFVDPTRCKGCAACVQVCAALGHHALVSIPTVADEGTGESTLARYRRDLALFRTLPPTPAAYRAERAPADLVLGDHAEVFGGVAASCAGCGQAPIVRLLATVTATDRGPAAMGIVAAPGCGVVASWAEGFHAAVTRAAAPDLVTAITSAVALRSRWDAEDHADRPVWVIAGDPAVDDAGVAALDALIASGHPVKVLLLATDAPGGRDLGPALVGRYGAFVAQTTAAHLVHAAHVLADAVAFPGPAVVVAYTPCQPAHGIAEEAAYHQARLAVEARVAPLFSHDPRRGAAMSERLSLQGNPAIEEDRAALPDGTPIDLVAFARTEGRFAAHFAKDGRPSSELRGVEAERLAAWRSLQELAGVR